MLCVFCISILALCVFLVFMLCFHAHVLLRCVAPFPCVCRVRVLGLCVLRELCSCLFASILICCFVVFDCRCYTHPFYVSACGCACLFVCLVSLRVQIYVVLSFSCSVVECVYVVFGKVCMVHFPISAVRCMCACSRCHVSVLCVSCYVCCVCFFSCVFLCVGLCVIIIIPFVCAFMVAVSFSI